QRFEMFLAGGNPILGRLAARQRQDVRSDFVDAALAEHGAERGHHALPAVRDGFVDAFRLTAPQPIVVREVRKTSGTARIGAVARRAVGRDEVARGRHRLRIAGELLERLILERGEPRLELLALERDLLLVLRHLAPAAQAAEITEPGVQRLIY